MTNFTNAVYQYAAKNDKNNRIYIWGLSEHGALGEREFLKPVNKSRNPVKYMHRPYRLGFADTNEVMFFTLPEYLC